MAEEEDAWTVVTGRKSKTSTLSKSSERDRENDANSKGAQRQKNSKKGQFKSQDAHNNTRPKEDQIPGGSSSVNSGGKGVVKGDQKPVGDLGWRSRPYDKSYPQKERWENDNGKGKGAPLPHQKQIPSQGTPSASGRNKSSEALNRPKFGFNASRGTDPESKPSGSWRDSKVERVRPKESKSADVKRLSFGDGETKSLRKEVPNQGNSKPATTPPSETSDQVPKAKKKKKRNRVSKEEQRKKREEKFYQGLNQKDSHIQFVSAEVIKQMRQQSDSFKTPANKSSVDANSNPGLPIFYTALPESLTPLRWPQTNSYRSRPGNCSDYAEFPFLSTASPPVMPSTSSANVNVKTEPERPINHQPNMKLWPISEHDNPSDWPASLQSFTPTKNEPMIKSSSKSKPATAPVPSQSFDSPKQPDSVLPNTALTPSKGKKSKQPLVIDVSALIASSSKKKESSEKKPFIGGLGLHGKSPGGGRKVDHKLTAGNPLDSSGPGVIHRGKIRDKKKKPSKLKLTILRSRALRKTLLEEKTKQEEALKAEQEKTKEDFELVEVKGEDVTPTKTETILEELEGAHHQTVKVEPPEEEGTILVKGLLEENTKHEESLKAGLEEEPKEECVEAPSPRASPPSIPDTDSKEPEPESVEVKADTVVGVSVTPVKAEPIQEISEIHEESLSPCPHPQIEVKLEPPEEEDIQAHLEFRKLLDKISLTKTEPELSPEIKAAVKTSMHTRKFREYCDMYTSKELHKLVSNLLHDLHKFQDRLYHSDPIKFKTKRRYVSGLKEALAYLELNKVQLLIIAPDIEKNPEAGGLDDLLNKIMTSAKSRNIPYVFSGSKYNLGKSIKIKTPISVVSVLDKQNCEETFRKLLDEACNLREKYQNELLSKARDMTISSSGNGQIISEIKAEAQG